MVYPRPTRSFSSLLAAITSLVGNWRKALQHASQALQLEPSSLKACFRWA